MNPMQLDKLCLLNGCQIARAGQLATEANKMLDMALYERTKNMAAMSHASLWCDLGEHSFSSRDRKRTVYTVQTLDEETGEPVQDELMACGPHAAERKAVLAPKAALPAGVDRQEYTEFLEWRNGLRAQPPVVQGQAEPQ